MKETNAFIFILYTYMLSYRTSHVYGTVCLHFIDIPCIDKSMCVLSRAHVQVQHVFFFFGRRLASRFNYKRNENLWRLISRAQNMQHISCVCVCVLRCDPNKSNLLRSVSLYTTSRQAIGFLDRSRAVDISGGGYVLEHSALCRIHIHLGISRKGYRTTKTNTFDMQVGCCIAPFDLVECAIIVHLTSLSMHIQQAFDHKCILNRLTNQDNYAIYAVSLSNLYSTQISQSISYPTLSARTLHITHVRHRPRGDANYVINQIIPVQRAAAPTHYTSFPKGALHIAVLCARCRPVSSQTP